MKIITTKYFGQIEHDIVPETVRERFAAEENLVAINEPITYTDLGNEMKWHNFGIMLDKRN